MYQHLLKVIEKTPSVSGGYAKELVALFMGHHENHHLKYRQITFGYLKILSIIRGLSKFLLLNSELFNILLRMLGSGELKLQELSFECVVHFKDNSLEKYAGYIREMIKEESFFDTLTSFDDKNLEATTMILDVVSRVLFGKLISKSGRSSKNLTKSRRKAIFGFLAKFRTFLRPFIDLMVQPFVSENSYKVDRYELGFLSILEDCISQLQLFLSPDILSRLCDSLVFIGRQPDVNIIEEVENEESDKNMRTLCLKRWRQLFEMDSEMDFSPYRSSILENLLSHKIKKFACENTQAPSSILLICAVWAKSTIFAEWLFDKKIDGLVANIIAIMSEKKVKDSVISVVLSIIEDLQNLCLTGSPDEIIAINYRRIFPEILFHSKNVLKASLDSRKILPYQMRLISIISEAALLGAKVEDCLEILEILFPYLKKPSKFFSEKLKIHLMNIFISFSDCIPKDQKILDFSMHFRIISQLYSTLETRLARQALNNVMNVFASWDSNMIPISELLKGFNSFDEKRIDEPDFKKQMKAFAQLNNELLHKLNRNQWLPVIYQLLYSVKSLDYATRNSAALSLELFITMAANPKSLADDESSNILNLVEHVILPAIKGGLKSAPETVRVEYMRFLGVIIKLFKSWKLSEELSELLGTDDETNFFSNIYHLQLHRRSRAMRSLEALIAKGHISSSTISNIFMPLLNHFILESKGNDHNFTNDVIRVIGACSKFLNWAHYSAYVNQYLHLFQKSNEIEKTIFRTIIHIMEAFHFKVTKLIQDQQVVTSSGSMENSTVSLMSVQKLVYKLEDLFPSKPAESASRIQVAYALSIIYKQYPAEEGELKVLRLLSKLSIMLSNHVQDYRDISREVLAKIIQFWGSSVFPTAIKQLHLHLDKGYKKHIVAYTLHWLLVQVLEIISPSDLDSVLEVMVNICIDDMFGIAAEEKEVGELKSKFKEIKKSKSLDSLELLAGAINFKSVAVLLVPIKEVMMVITDSKSIGIMREAFRRISFGINSNKTVNFADLFPFIRELLTENFALSRVNADRKKKTQRESNFMVQMKRPSSKDPLKTLASNAYLFIDFGLALFLSFLKNGDSSKICLTLFDPFVDILGSLLYSVHDSVLSQVLKVWCILINLRLPKLESAVPVVLKRTIEIVTNNADLDSELSQMALRLLSILIREGHTESLSSNQIAAVLSILKPNLDEPSKQSFVFGLVQSIISTKIVCNEVYDIMEEIMRNMIVNQTDSIRNICRLTFVKFLLTYPHGQAKLDKLVEFIVKGLEYEYESGRLTILETINDMVEKFSESVLAEYFEMFFVALVLDMINDESSKCKEVSAEVFKTVLLRASNAQTDKLTTVIHAWHDNSSNKMLQRAAMQVYGIMIETCSEKLGNWMDGIIERAAKVLNNSIQQPNDFIICEQSVEETDWALTYYAISLFSKAMVYIPDVSSTGTPVDCLKELLLHSHQWVRSITGKLLGQIFSFYDSCSSITLKDKLKDEDFLLSLGKKVCLQLDSTTSLTDEFSVQIVKNLVFISKQMIIIDKENDKEHLLILIKLLSRKSKQEASKSRNTLIVTYFILII